MTIKLIIHAESGIKSNLKLSSANDIVQFLALLPVYLRIEDRDRVSIFLSQKLESSIFKKFDLFAHSSVTVANQACSALFRTRFGGVLPVGSLALVAPSLE